MLKSPWTLCSRVHPLNHFPKQCFVKREDELSCGVSGSKLRKYASLLPILLDRKVKRLLVIAGAQSNNLLAAVQLAREYRLNITALLLKPWCINYTGNYALSRLFLDETDIVWIERKDWPDIRGIAEKIARENSEPCFILDEGASVAEALEGAMTLADDILRNEQHMGIQFQHIFIDAGTGFSAMAMAHRLQQLGHDAMVHVLLLADKESKFYERVLSLLPTIPKNIKSFSPSTAKAFGAVNQSIKSEIKRVAREEGILLDPIYSAKLFYTVRRKIAEEALKGNKLLIHSGGILSLTGFDLRK